MAMNIAATGMVTPVGYNAPSSCAAIRVGIDGFRETRFKFDGEWLRAGVVPQTGTAAGRPKLLSMAIRAVEECLPPAPPVVSADTILLLCLPEMSRPGRLDQLDETFGADLRAGLQHPDRVDPDVRIFAAGSTGGIEALAAADQLLARGPARYCVLAGVDTYVVATTLGTYHEQRRLVTEKNSDGFVPGEAAAAVLLTRLQNVAGSLQCLGLGRGREPAIVDSGIPLRAEGLVQAYREAFHAAGFGYEHLDYRLTDIAGEQLAFKEASLALSRTMRIRKSFFDLWHPADCVGRVGAAAVPLALGVALRAATRAYAPGPGVLCHFADDSGARAAAVLREFGKASHPPLP